jgi:hypothetical protein
MMNGNNLTPATPDVIGEGVRKFEEMTGLDVQDAQLSRLDVAMNMYVERSVRECFDVMMLKRDMRNWIMDLAGMRTQNRKARHS